MFNEKKNEENVVHIHTTEYLSCSLKKKEVLFHATIWINLEDIVLSEKSQSL